MDGTEGPWSCYQSEAVELISGYEHVEITSYF
jgi:hypothetical protein